MENDLASWFRKRVENGEYLQKMEIKEKAMEISKSMDPDGEFTASNGWYRNFSRRFKTSPVPVAREFMELVPS